MNFFRRSFFQLEKNQGLPVWQKTQGGTRKMLARNSTGQPDYHLISRFLQSICCV